MPNYRLLPLTGWMLLALHAGAQPQSWHKIIRETPICVPFCHVLAEGDNFLVSTDRHWIEVDQNGSLAGFFETPIAVEGFWTTVLKKYDSSSGRPYFILARRGDTVPKDVVLETYEPGTGFSNKVVFSDSLGSIQWLRPQLIALNDSSFVVFGRQFYRKVIFSKTTGFVEQWARPLDFSPTASCFVQQQFILADETGRLAALDENGNLLWTRQYPFGFRALKPIPGGLIACGHTPGNEAVLLRLTADGKEVWTSSGAGQDLYDVVQIPGGGFAATGVSPGSEMLLARYDAGGALLWSREYAPGAGASLLALPKGGWVLLGQRGGEIHLIKTDANGFAPPASDIPLQGQVLQTQTLQATFYPGSKLFYSNLDPGLVSLADGGAGTILTCAPWIGGKDDADALHLAASDYEPDSYSDFRPGLFNTPGGDFKRIWKVTQADIRQVRRDFGDNRHIDGPVPADVLTWLGKGNPYLRYNRDFTPVQTDPELFPAPFVDVNADGLYNVFDGDYPEIQGDQMLWWAITDSTAHLHSHGLPLIVDLFISAYTYDCTDNSLIDHSLFVDIETRNRSNTGYTDAYMGFFTDPDLGCPNDDYIGYLPGADAWYVYNADVSDDSCAWILPTQGFGTHLPVQTIALLNQSLDHGLYSNVAKFGDPGPFGFDPDLPNEFYSLLTGVWKGGRQPTRGGTGYNPNSTDYTDFVFPDNPADPQGWSMCTTQPALFDWRLLASHGPFVFDAVQSFKIRLAFTLHPDIPHPCPDIFGLVQPALEQIRQWDGAGALDLNPGLEPVYFLAPGQTLQLDASVAQGSYHWSTGNNTAAINVHAPGTYSVTITGATGCVRTETVEVREQPVAPRWQLWPNPARQQSTVHFTDGQGCAACSTRLFNARGQLVARQTGLTVGLSGLPAGLYWVELRDGETGMGVRKVVKQ